MPKCDERLDRDSGSAGKTGLAYIGPCQGESVAIESQLVAVQSSYTTGCGYRTCACTS